MKDTVGRLRSALPRHYLIERELGRGGMATVYLAEDTRNHRRVAVKVLHEDYASAIGRTRFLREIEIEAKLTHPGIIPLFDSGASDDLVWYVMPYVEGESLRELLDREIQLPMERVLRIAREVAEALAYAHEHGVIHRDIKPANILLTGGRAQVADFGIARAMWASGASQTTSAGMAVGTPQYMSPEQAAAGRVDGRTDVWALGCVIYEMLAGTPPFTGATPDSVFARARTEVPPALEVVRPGVGRAVQAVIERALAKVPADRWQSPTAFVDALESAAAAPESGEYLPARRRRARWWAGMVAAAGAMAVVAGLWHPWARQPSLDSNGVLVFPLREAAGVTAGTGEDLAQVITSALESAEPLRVVNGWTWLTPAQRRDVALLAVGDADRIARERRARYVVDGVVLRIGDSARVALRLFDVRGDSLVAQETSAPALARDALLPRAALGVVARLLPRLLGEGRAVDLSALSDPDPAAVAQWLLGDRYYRRSRFDSALVLYRRALATDSTLTYAAFKGAQAANWAADDELALRLDSLALRSPRRLPPRFREYAQGFLDYLLGRADSAAARLRRALAADSAWSGAWMVLGEIYFHLLPEDVGADAVAGGFFERAHHLDPWFAPAIYHLGQIAVRAGETARAESLLARFRQVRPDSTYLLRLAWMVECARGGVRAVDWSLAARHPRELTEVARADLTALAQPVCAERALRTLFAASDTAADLQGVRWGAFLGLHALLLAQGRFAEARTFLESELARGMRGVYEYFTLDAPLGAGTDSGAAVATALLPSLGPMAGWPVRRLWDRAVWASYRGEGAVLDSVVAVLVPRIQRGGAMDSSVFWSAFGRLRLLRGDTAGAIGALRSVQAVGTTSELLWEPIAAFPEERLMLARLLDARGEHAEALRMAEVFDHPAPVAYPAYVPASLVLRERAARALGRGGQADRYRARLAALGRSDLR